MPQKKKKPSANPNRGFATTSVASKPKPSKSESGTETPDTSINTSKHDTANVTGSASPAVINKQLTQQPEKPTEQSKELNELSPEELEKRLEEADLQNFLDRHSAKAIRDSTRCVSKLQTECRVLRGQASPLTLRTLLPDDLTLKLVALAREDVNQGKYFADDIRSRSLPSDDELTARLWILQRALLGIGFSEGQVDSVLRYIVRIPPLSDNDTAVWGLDEAFDWLSCNIPEEELPTLDTSTGKSVLPRKSQPSDHLALPGEDLADDSNGRSAKPTELQEQSTEEANGLAQDDQDDVEVSDLGSDLEPDQLQTSYLNTKTKLFELHPDLAPAPPTRSSKGKKSSAKPAARSIQKLSVGAKRLQDKLRRIEQDSLFEQGEAEFQWSNHRILLAREAVERRQTQRSADRKAKEKGKPEVHEELSQNAGSAGASSADLSDNDDTALNDLFAAMPSEAKEQEETETVQDHSSVQIRDFGATKGVEPRRILEEACKARDSSVKINYKLVSTAAFANRHLVNLAWSKDQLEAFSLESPAVQSSKSSRKMVFSMSSVATPDTHQSIAYVAVFALFQIFSSSPKEEKVYLRLPQNWRNLWFELAELSKSQSQARERENVQMLRDIVSSDRKNDDSDEDIIFTKNFKKRNEASQRELRGPGAATSDTNEQSIRRAWVDKSNTPQYQQMLRSRSRLPMTLFKQAALEAITANQVLVLCGETGCGKSTQMPAFILEHQMSQGKPCKIYCTEPRRISAITLAQRVSEELGENQKDLGTSRSFVGYSIRLETKVSSSSRLIYATTGVVLRMLEQSEALADTTHIVIDEVHERSIETDFLLIILRTLCGKRPDLKVILMSATVDAERFSKYFYGAPVLNVPGRTFPVDTKFLEDAVELTGHVVDDADADARDDDDEVDAETVAEQATKTSNSSLHFQQYGKKTRDTIAKMDQYNIDYKLITALIEKIASDSKYEQYSRAILVFLPGIAEIRRMADTLSGSWVGQRFFIHSLHSSIASEDQQAAFQLPPHGMGKLVLSTNIAETGVTIPDITCVIDTGQHKEMRFDERRQISRLLNCSISRANAKQRRGRAGRVQEGLCFHLFTKPRHDESLADSQTPEMLRLSLQDLIIRVKICKLGDIQSTLADALDPPLPKNIRRAIDALIEVGALTSQEELTALGTQLSRMPLDPYLGKLVLFGSFFKCLDVALTLAATLTSKTPFVFPMGARKQAETVHSGFKKGDSDLLTQFNAYAAWRKVCSSSNMSEIQFCRRNFLSGQNLGNIEDLKAQLLSNLAEAGYVDLAGDDRKALGRIQNSGSRKRRFVQVPPELNANSENVEVVSTAIAWAFYPKILVREGKGWRNIATNQSISIHPTSILRQAPSPSFANVKFLSFYSILQSSSGAKNVNANSLTPVSGVCLALLGGAAAFHPTAHVISVDSARMRFAIDAPRQRVWSDAAEDGGAPTVTVVGVWKTYVAVKFLRRRLEEATRRRWRRPEERFPGLLARWLVIWDEVMAHWKSVET